MPQDVSVVCYDNTPVAVKAGLTTVGVNPEKMGKKAMEMLFGFIEDADADKSSVMFRPEMTIRNSVKKMDN